jgi:hypothetical protein
MHCFVAKVGLARLKKVFSVCSTEKWKEEKRRSLKYLSLQKNYVTTIVIVSFHDVKQPGFHLSQPTLVRTLY